MRGCKICDGDYMKFVFVIVSICASDLRIEKENKMRKDNSRRKRKEEGKENDRCFLGRTGAGE